MDYNDFTSEAIEWAAHMAVAGMDLLESLEGSPHNKTAACELLAAILGLRHLEERYEPEWWFKESP